MDINHVLSFVKVAECGSFSEAAEQLFTTQSSVSKHVLALEKELNVQLFDRQNRKVKLTEAGKELLGDTKALVDSYLQLVKHASDLSLNASTQLAIASIPVMAQYNITGILADFQNNYPHIQLDILETEGHSIISLLNTKQVTFAFMRLEYIDSFFNSIPLATDELSVVLCKNHPLASSQQISLDQLKDENFLLLNKSTLLYDLVVDACQANGFCPNVTYAGTRMENILELVARNQGVSLMMSHAVSYIPRKGVRVIPLVEHIKSSVGLVYLKNTSLHAPARLFRDYVAQNFNSSRS